MKRILVLTALSLGATFVVTASSQGQTSVPFQAATQQVTANTTPKRDRFRPHTFTTTGRVLPPPLCPAGVVPTSDGGPCVPPICPPGSASAPYCVNPPTPLLCRGKVLVTFQRVVGRLTISSRRVDLKSDCTYSSRVTFRLRLAQRRGRIFVKVRFEGNALIQAKDAPRQTVRIG